MSTYSDVCEKIAINTIEHLLYVYSFMAIFKIELTYG